MATITSTPSTQSLGELAQASKPAQAPAQAAPGLSNKAKQPSELEQLRARLAESEAETARLKAAAQHKSTLSVKISTKQALSVYGLGRFPVTLYGAQWLRLLDPVVVAYITQYITDHRSELEWKE